MTEENKHYAQEILNNPVFSEAIKKLNDDVERKILKASDRDEAFNAVLLKQSSVLFIQKIQSYIDDQLVSSHNSFKREQQKEKKSEFKR